VFEAFVSPMGVDGFMPTQVCTRKKSEETISGFFAFNQAGMVIFIRE
jgi:hypothetical protein